MSSYLLCGRLILSYWLFEHQNAYLDKTYSLFFTPLTRSEFILLALWTAGIFKLTDHLSPPREMCENVDKSHICVD